MTLTRHFNAKSKINRRQRTETDTFGGKSLSRYFASASVRRQRQEKEVVVKVVVARPRIIRRGMNI